MSDTLPGEYYDTVEIHDRTFQRYSVDHSIYPVPIDEVRLVSHDFPEERYPGLPCSVANVFASNASSKHTHNAQEEEERLETQHRLIYYLFDERLFFPPLSYPMSVLDCGYGRGSWADNFARTYPESQASLPLTLILSDRDSNEASAVLLYVFLLEASRGRQNSRVGDEPPQADCHKGDRHRYISG